MLHSCEEIIVHGLATGSLSAREAELANQTLLLARPWHGTDRSTVITAQELYDHAENWPRCATCPTPWR